MGIRFIGNAEAKLDAKGRVFLPAVFRRSLQTAGEERLYLRRDVFTDCLVLYPESTWNQTIDRITEGSNVFDRKRRAALRQFVADAEEITLDGNGRFLISRRLLQQVNMMQTVRFIGMDDTIEIWSKENADLITSDDLSQLGETLEACFSCQDVQTRNESTDNQNI